MPTLVIDNIPASLFARISDLAMARRLTPSAAALAMLEDKLSPTREGTRAPGPIFLTEDMTASCSIPRPEGRPVRAVRVSRNLPTSHDFPDEE